MWICAHRRGTSLDVSLDTARALYVKRPLDCYESESRIASLSFSQPKRSLAEHF